MKTMKKHKNNDRADIAIIGTGDIARRHLKNAQNLLPNKKVLILKRSPQSLNSAFNKYKNFIVHSIDEINPMSKKSIAIICSPASLHIKDSIDLAKKGFNLLIEKPLSINNSRISDLINLRNEKNIRIMIGYNLRYHEAICKLKNLLVNKSLGELKHVHFHVGSLYKVWRKSKNSMNSVTANKKLGGGVINELSHEVDLMVYLLGLPDKMLSLPSKSIADHVDIDDTCTSLFLYSKNKSTVTIHQNITSSNHSRYSIYEFDNGTIKVDLIENYLYFKTKRKTETIRFKSSIDDTYILQLEDFINNKKNHIFNLYDSINVVSIIQAMKKSKSKFTNIFYNNE